MKSSMLFPDPSGDLCDFLDRLPGLLERARPQKSRHRDRLPQGVEELSNLLTIDRDHLPPDYMARPPLLAAYLHYFLPWNLVRQVRLLGGLAAHLDLKPDASIVDVGAGPLTFALAMWLALPQLRTRRLDITAEDRTDAPMRVGRDLLRSLDSAGSWRVALSRPAGMGGRQGSSGTPRRKADLLVAANVMNEIPRGAHRTAGNPGASLQALLRSWERRLTPHGRILVIEPGVRDACRMLTDLRGLALERGRHVGIDTFRNALPDRYRWPVLKLTDLCGLCFSLYLAYLGWGLVRFVLASGQRSPTLDLPMGWIYAAPVVGFALLALRFGLSLFGVIDRFAAQPEIDGETR